MAANENGHSLEKAFDAALTVSALQIKSTHHHTRRRLNLKRSGCQPGLDLFNPLDRPEDKGGADHIDQLKNLL
jgi:hypothetical protein